MKCEKCKAEIKVGHTEREQYYSLILKLYKPFRKRISMEIPDFLNRRYGVSDIRLMTVFQLADLSVVMSESI